MNERITKLLQPWRRIPLALKLAGLAGISLLFGLVFVFAYPLWADSVAASMAASKIKARGGFSRVEFSDFDLQRDKVVARALDLEGEGFSIHLEGLDIGYEARWSARQVAVLSARVDKAVIGGDAAALLKWAKARRRPASPQATGGAASGSASGRVLLRPKVVHLRQAKVLLDTDALTGGLVRKFAAQVAALAEQGRVSVEAKDIEAEGIGDRKFGASEVKTALNWGASMRDLQFPAKVLVEGGYAELSPRVAVDGVWGHVELPDASLQKFALDLRGGFSDRGEIPRKKGDGEELWSLRGAGRRDLSQGNIRLEMAAFDLGRVPRVLSQLPLVDSEKATVGGRLDLKLAAGKVDIQGALALAGLNMSHPLLAREPVRDVGFEVDLEASLDPAARHLEIRHAELRRKKLRMTVAGFLKHPQDPSQRHYLIDLKIPPLACQALVDSIPEQLVPAVQGMKLQGKYLLDVHFDANFADLEAMELTGLRGSFGLAGCHPERVPGKLHSSRLDGAMIHRVTMRDGSERRVSLRDGSPTFTRLEEIAPAMMAAVLSTEDGGFWRHQGFLTSQFRHALRANLEAGKVRLGASTISMQLVKNLLLSHERTLSRKLQEVFLTWYIEKTLPKARIMELYLNIVEFGPGIYGVTNAAEHYFGKAPSQLSSIEAAYLALMLPSPVIRHQHYCRARLTPAFDTKLRRVHRIMKAKERIPLWMFETYKNEPIEFDLSDRSTEEKCLERIDLLMEGEVVQMALSGLLGPNPNPNRRPRLLKWTPAPEREAPPEKVSQFAELDSLGSIRPTGVPAAGGQPGQGLAGGAAEPALPAKKTPRPAQQALPPKSKSARVVRPLPQGFGGR